MPLITCSITIAGVIDRDDAQILSAHLDNLGAGFGVIPSLGCLEDEQKNFLLSISSSFFPDKQACLPPEPLAQSLSDLHLSYCFSVSTDPSNGISNCRIKDVDLGLEASFTLEEHTCAADTLTPEDPLWPLAIRWSEYDTVPPLHFISSRHQALDLARNPGSMGKYVTAYFARKTN